jgi:anti-sigma regulatory factor (Ser/Thr protein kinase)
MPTVHLAFSPDPAYVRTVRLVAAVVAQRAGITDPVLDEVRLAIGEACSWAISLHRRHLSRDLIDVWMSTDDDRFTIRVADRSPNGSIIEAGSAEPTFDLGEAEEDTADMAVAVLTGLVTDLKVVHAAPAASGSEVRMSWPVKGRSAN